MYTVSIYYTGLSLLCGKAHTSMHKSIDFMRLHRAIQLHGAVLCVFVQPYPERFMLKPAVILQNQHPSAPPPPVLYSITYHPGIRNKTYWSSIISIKLVPMCSAHTSGSAKFSLALQAPFLLKLWVLFVLQLNCSVASGSAEKWITPHSSRTELFNVAMNQIRLMRPCMENVVKCHHDGRNIRLVSSIYGI